MVDHEAADWIFWIKHPPITPGPTRLSQLRTQNLRHSVWLQLVENAGDDGYVVMSPLQIAAATGRTPRQSRNVRLAMKWLCNASLMVDAGERGPHTYRLLVPGPDGSPAPPRQRRPRDPRLEAYDQRAAAWNLQRRRMWRPVWRAMLLCADPEGIVIGDVAVLADVACDRFGARVSDATVAKVVRWSVASGMTEYVYRGRVPVLRVIAGIPRRPGAVAPP